MFHYSVTQAEENIIKKIHTVHMYGYFCVSVCLSYQCLSGLMFM